MADEQGFSDFFYTAPDGLQLHGRLYGEANPDLWPVVCLPGLTRNCRDFHELALYLSTRAEKPRRVVAFDYRGRGQSAYDPDINYNVIAEAGDVLAGLDALGIDRAAFIGTSRGGLILHVLGAMRPAALKAVVLNDIGPAIETAGLAQISAYLDRAPTPKSFADAVQAQRATHGRDFPALTDADWERMVRALYRETDKGWLPDFDPKLIETLADVDFSMPLPTLWAQFDMLAAVPMLTLRGDSSALLSTQTLAEMQNHHPGMKTMTVEGQGHAPFLETGTLPREIADFIDNAAKAEQNADRQRLSTSANR
jgi:pimeloyl-ACP methyl ester carboxylesterase